MLPPLVARVFERQLAQKLAQQRGVRGDVTYRSQPLAYNGMKCLIVCCRCQRYRSSGSCIRPQMKPCAGSPLPPWLQQSRKAFTSHRVPFHYGCHGDAHTAAPRLSALHSIPAPSCSPNLHRPTKCDETTPCRTEASATRHWARSRPSDLSQVAEAREVIRSLPLLASYCTPGRKTLHKTGCDSVLFAEDKAITSPTSFHYVSP